MKLVRLLGVFAVMGTIFFLSSLPGDSFSLPDIIDIDKVLHALVYGVLALTVLFAIPEERYRRNPWLASLLVVVFCLLFGISDEYHQSFVPYRTPSVPDLGADTIGAVIVVSLWFKWIFRKISCC